MANLRERHPHAYLEGNEDPRTRKRTVPLEVLSANFSRTGTMSMRKALSILGMPCWHNVDMLANPPDMDLWSELLIRKFDPPRAACTGLSTDPITRKELDNLLGYWGGITDQPAVMFTEEIVQAYPDAKVVLVERDEDAWVRSYCAGPIDSTFNPWVPLASILDSFQLARTCRLVDLTMKYYFNVNIPRATGLWNNEEAKRIYEYNSREMYRRHVAMVKRVVPKERLLIFRLDQGWGPLCEFLGKEVPDVPFPRVNETAAVKELAEVYIMNAYKRALKKLALRSDPVVIGLVAVVWWWKNKA